MKKVLLILIFVTVISAVAQQRPLRLNEIGDLENPIAEIKARGVLIEGTRDQFIARVNRKFSWRALRNCILKNLRTVDTVDTVDPKFQGKIKEVYNSSKQYTNGKIAELRREIARVQTRLTARIAQQDRKIREQEQTIERQRRAIRSNSSAIRSNSSAIRSNRLAIRRLEENIRRASHKSGAGWVRIGDTQICWGSFHWRDTEEFHGGTFYRKDFSFPKKFKKKPMVHINANTTSPTNESTNSKHKSFTYNMNVYKLKGYSGNYNGCIFQFKETHRKRPNSYDIEFHYIAIGKWK